MDIKSLYSPDVNDLLAKWDADQIIWSIELGGMGPGYEQAIQVAAVEFARAGRLMERGDDERKNWTNFKAICDEALKAIDEKLGGITGAMFGAAAWLAYQWCFNGGPEKLIERAKDRGEESRIIQVSKFAPKV